MFRRFHTLSPQPASFNRADLLLTLLAVYQRADDLAEHRDSIGQANGGRLLGTKHPAFAEVASHRISNNAPMTRDGLNKLFVNFVDHLLRMLLATRRSAVRRCSAPLWLLDVG